MRPPMMVDSGALTGFDRAGTGIDHRGLDVAAIDGLQHHADRLGPRGPQKAADDEDQNQRRRQNAAQQKGCIHGA